MNNQTSDPMIVDAQQLLDRTKILDKQIPEDFKERLSMFGLLENARRELEDLTKILKKRVSAIGEVLHEELAELGMLPARSHGLTVYAYTELLVQKKANDTGATTQAVCEALTTMGRGDMVSDTYSSASLKSLVREILDDEQEVPEHLAKLFRIERETKLRSRKS